MHLLTHPVSWVLLFFCDIAIFPISLIEKFPPSTSRIWPESHSLRSQQVIALARSCQLTTPISLPALCYESSCFFVLKLFLQLCPLNNPHSIHFKISTHSWLVANPTTHCLCPPLPINHAHLLTRPMPWVLFLFCDNIISPTLMIEKSSPHPPCNFDS